MASGWRAAKLWLAKLLGKKSRLLLESRRGCERRGQGSESPTLLLERLKEGVLGPPCPTPLDIQGVMTINNVPLWSYCLSFYLVRSARNLYDHSILSYPTSLGM